MTQYQVWVSADAKREARALPGHMRQRVKRAIAGLVDDPRPSQSKALRGPGGMEWEIWCIRIDRWRIVYAIDEPEKSVGVYAIRRRPPYNYDDLALLFG
jgi:mRNA interferase RelE/StbE